MARRKVLISWSSGKDSAWALHILQQKTDMEVTGLLTTVNSRFDRVAMHAVGKGLLLEQAASTGLKPWVVEIPHPCTNEEYEGSMREAVKKAKGIGITAVAFGDLFLEEVRRYREKMFEGTGIEPIFPLWMADTKKLARTMQKAGLKARITCVDPEKLNPRFAGRLWDGPFLEDLPRGIDPCGENGEFHTFVFDGPMLKRPVKIHPGRVVKREGFVFADLILR